MPSKSKQSKISVKPPFLKNNKFIETNSHTIQCTHLKCIIKWVLVYSQRYAIIAHFYFLGIMNNAVMNIHVQIFV